MSKDAPTTDLPPAQANESMQNSMDSFGNILAVPVRKLDADEYTANDLDGVTESATGSGNLNFLMMQAGQTNEAMSNLNPFNIANGGDNPYFNAINGAGGQGYELPGAGNGFDTAMDRGFDGTANADGQGQLNNTGNTSSNAGSLGASNFAASSTFANPFSSTSNFSSLSSSTGSGGPPVPPINGANGTNGNSGTDGTSGTSGIDGTNGTDGTGTTIVNIDDRAFETVENILNENITNVFDTVNNVTNNVTDILNQSTTNIFDTVNNVTNNLTDILNESTTNIFDTVNNVTNNVTDIVNNIFDNEGNGLGTIGLNLDLLLDNITNINLDIINGGTITNVLNETLNTAPVLVPVQNLLGNLLSHTSLDVLINPFQPDTGAGDTDLHVGTNLDVLGIHVPDIGIDIPLDLAEGLLGDIDIGLDVTNDILGGVPLLGDLFDGGGGNGDTDLAVGGLGGILNATQLNDAAGAILNPVENLIGDVDIGGALGLDLLGLDSGQTGPDTDISIPLDIGLIDSPLLNDGLNISLDPLENIIGDIDLDLGVAGNILGNVAPNLFDNAAGGNGQNDLLAQIGDGLSGLGHHILPFGDGSDSDITLSTGIGAGGFDALGNGLDIILDPVETITGDIDLNGALGLDLLGTGGGTGVDSDLTIDLGMTAPVEIDLDFVETVTGDVDLDIDLQSLIGDTLGGFIDPLTPAFDETLNNLDILGGAAQDGLHSVADSIDDITGGAGLDSILGNGSGGLTGLLDTAITLLDSSAPSTGGLDLGAITGGLTGGATDPVGTITTWTETVLPNAGDLLGGGLHTDPVTSIPDPVLTTPVLSLPAVPVVPSIPVVGGLLGGLGGHHGHGGLFG